MGNPRTLPSKSTVENDYLLSFALAPPPMTPTPPSRSPLATFLTSPLGIVMKFWVQKTFSVSSCLFVLFSAQPWVRRTRYYITVELGRAFWCYIQILGGSCYFMTGTQSSQSSVHSTTSHHPLLLTYPLLGCPASG